MELLDDVEGLAGAGSPTDHHDVSRPQEKDTLMMRLVSPAPRCPPQFQQRSSELTLHLRDRKEIVALRRKLDVKYDKLEEVTKKQRTLIAAAPAIAKYVGIEAPALKRNEMSLERAEMLLRVVADTSPQAAHVWGLGVRLKTLRCFQVDLIKDLQFKGLLALFLKCAAFRRAGHGYILCRIRFESDGTQQKLAQYLFDMVGRPSRKRLATEVMNMSCVITVKAVGKQHGEELFSFSHPWFCSSLALLGKTGIFIATCWQRSLPFDFESASARGAIQAAFDTFQIDFAEDQGSNNMPALRHFADIFYHEYTNATFDVTNCLIHIGNRIKNTNTLLTQTMGTLYSLGASFKVSSYCVDLSKGFGRLSKLVQRVELEPPANIQRTNYMLMDELFQLDGQWHTRKDGKPSAFKQDLLFFLEMVNDDFTDQSSWVHYCWPPGHCRDQADTQRKWHEANNNLFVTSGIPQGCASRFTHSDHSLAKTIAGRSCKSVLIHAMPRGSKQKCSHVREVVENPEELGAHAADLQTTHASRVGKVHSRLSDDKQLFLLPCIRVTTQPIMEIEYALFGSRDRASVKVHELMHRDTSPIVLALEKYWTLLDEWNLSLDGPWRLLRLCGVTSLDEEWMRVAARREVIHMSSGTTLHLDIAISEELSVYNTVDDRKTGYAEVETEALRRSIEVARACDLSIFTRMWRRMFPTVSDMASVLSQAHLKLSRDGKVLHTHRSERGHARERKDLNAASAPGKSFVHHSRNEIMWQVNNRHVQNNGIPPTDGVQALRLSERARLSSTDLFSCQADPFDKYFALEAGVDPTTACYRTDLQTVCIQDVCKYAGTLSALDRPPRAFALVDLQAPLAIADAAPKEIISAKVHANASAAKPARGGSIQMTRRNNDLALFKKSVGGRKLTWEEVKQVRRDSDLQFSQASDEAKAVHKRQFQREHRQRQSSDSNAISEEMPSSKKYLQHFNCLGNKCFATCPEHFIHRWKHFGFPKDERVFKEGSFIIHAEDCIPKLRGECMKLSSCLSSSRNVCPLSLELPKLIEYDAIAQALTACVEALPKEKKNDCTVVYLFEARSAEGERQIRHFFLLAKVVGLPKFQLFVECTWDPCNSAAVDAPELSCPFEIRIAEGRARISKDRKCISIKTSDEVALLLAGHDRGSPWSATELHYTIPHDRSLRRMIVSKLGKKLQFANRQSLKEGTANNRKFSLSTNALNASMANPFAAGRSRASLTAAPLALMDGPAQLDKSLNAHEIIENILQGSHAISTVESDYGCFDVLPPEDALAMGVALESGGSKGALHVEASDTDSHGSYPDLDAELPGENEEVHHDEVPPVSAASSSSSSATWHPAPIDPEGLDICDPSTTKYAEGYMRRPNSPSLCRVQPTKGNTAYKCYQHSSCSMIIYGWHPLPMPEVKRWIAGAELIQTHDSTAEKNRKRDSHLAALQKLKEKYAPAKK